MGIFNLFRKEPEIARPQWHPALKDAFARGSVFGLFVDYQRCYLHDSTREAFTNGAAISKTLQDKSIRSIWAMWPTHKPAEDTAAPFGAPYSDLQCNEDDDFTIATPAPLEAVFTKNAQNLLTNQRALNFVRAQETAVFIAGGVHAHACFGTSVIEIANEIDCDIIIAEDASNFPSTYDALAFLKCHSSWNHKSPPQGRIHMSTTEEILQNLDF
jgi:hypothetical protein